MQTLYPRPYFTKGYLILQTTLVVPAILFWITLGFESTPARVCWFAFYTFQILAILTDPVVCATTRTEERNGLTIKVKRPFVGLKRCETRVPDDVEGGVVYEKAYLRI